MRWSGLGATPPWGCGRKLKDTVSLARRSQFDVTRLASDVSIHRFQPDRSPSTQNDCARDGKYAPPQDTPDNRIGDQSLLLRFDIAIAEEARMFRNFDIDRMNSRYRHDLQLKNSCSEISSFDPPYQPIRSYIDGNAAHAG
jgi:hypothetical protein